MPVDKLTIEQFAQKVKEKYPQYKDVNDSELVNRMVEKYPEYKSRISYEKPSSFHIQLSNPTFKSSSLQPGVKSFDYEGAANPDNIYNLQGKARVAQEALHNELKNNKGALERVVAYDRLKKQIEKRKLGLPTTFEDYNTEITDEDINKLSEDAKVNQHRADEVLSAAVELNPEKSSQFQKNKYLVDAFNKAANDPNGNHRVKKIEDNAKLIEKGDLIYKDGVVGKPQGFFGSLITARNELNRLSDAYDYAKKMRSEGNEAGIITELNNRLKRDPDEPVGIPTGTMGNLAANIGGMPIKGMVAGIVASAGTSFLGNPEAAPAAFDLASAGVNANDMYKIGHQNALEQNYAAIKSAHPDMPDYTAYQQALDIADKQAVVDATSAAAMQYLGGKVGFGAAKQLTRGISSGLSEVKDELGKKAFEALGVGGIGSAGQVVKNIIAQNNGINTPTTQGATDQFTTGVLVTGAMSLLGLTQGQLKNATKSKIIAGLSKLPDDVIENGINKISDAGHLTPEQVNDVKSAIDEHKAIDNSIKSDVPESDRMKIQGLIKKRNELEASLEIEDKAYHPDIKEQIKSINEQIVNVSKGSERGELQKLVDQEHKAGNLQEFTSDVLRDASENDLNKYFKEISEQVYAGNEESAIQAFGENIVNKAKELYPQEVPKESKVSVIQPGEIKQPTEVRTISPREQPKEIKSTENVSVIMPKTKENAQAVRSNQGEISGEGNVGGQRPDARGEDLQQSTSEAPINGETEQQAGIPTQESSPEGQEGVEAPEQKQVAALTVDEAYGLPFIEEPSDKRTGIKNIISKTTRFERKLPPVEVDKLGSDQEILLQGKSLVDDNVINPVEVVNRILDTKEGMQPDEAKAMQYYMHQLSQQDINLRERLASASNEADRSEINGQLQQLSDEVDAATQANIISGKAWSDVGNIRQIVSDNGFNASRDLATIRDAYAGKIPKDVQAKLDKAFKERDEALSKLAKLQIEEKNKAAEDTIKKQVASKNAKKTKEQFKSERNDIKQSISEKLRQARSGESGLTAVPLPFAKELIAISPEIYKMIKSYAEEGIQKTEEVINRLHDVLKDEIDGISKGDIVNFLAGKYKEEERKLSPVSQRIRDYKTEASLWTKIEQATKMEEDTPAKKEEKNDKLRMLREKLNEIKTKNKEAIKSMQDILATDEQKEIKRLNKQRRALESKYKNKKYLMPTEERKTLVSEEILKEKQRIVNANYKIRIEKRRAFESQKSMYQKALMWVGRGVRLSVLSGYNVLGKLAAAATIGGAVKRIPEQAIGFIYGNAFKGVAEKAPIEGFVNASAEAKFYKEFLNPKTFAKNTWEILKSGESPLSKKFSPGTYEHIPGLYLPTDLHQVIKDPLKRATYEASLKNALAWAERNGMDINDDLVIQSIETAAYKRAQYEIFQEQNWLSKKFGEWKHNMEEAGNLGATGKFLADFMIPVSTVPTNIARRMAITSPFGLIKGAAGVVEAYRKGIESLTPEQADSVMRQLKQGTLGTALWLIGWYGYSQFGGLYSKFDPNKQRNQGDLVSDEMSVGGKMIPKPVQHALPLEIIQFAATARRVYDHYKIDKDKSTPEAIEKAGLASIGALSEQIPVIETIGHTIGAFNDPYEAKKLEEDAKRRVMPQILRETGVIGKENKGIWGEDENGGGANKHRHSTHTHIFHKHN